MTHRSISSPGTGVPVSVCVFEACTVCKLGGHVGTFGSMLLQSGASCSHRSLVLGVSSGSAFES